MSKRGIKKTQKRSHGYKRLFYSILAAPLIFVLIFLPVAQVFAASEAIDETVEVLEEIQELEETVLEVEVEEDESVSKSPEEESETVSEDTELPDKDTSLLTEGVKSTAATEESDLVDDTQVDSENNTEQATSSEDYTEDSVGENSATSTDTDQASTTDNGVSTTTDDDGQDNTGTDTSTTTDEEESDDDNNDTQEAEENDDTDDTENSDEHDESDNEEVSESEDKNATTTTDEIVTEVPSYVVNDENRYQFGTNDCVPVGDGSFYCNEKAVDEVVLEDAVFSAPDSGGDQEIYIRKDGIEYQITENDEDDLAPFYDPQSEYIVWHRLINDRYQIITLDLNKEEETQITNTRYNNMEPTAYDGVIVWQAWLENNWEVIQYDGSSTTRLTNSDGHDIAPHIRGDYIMWQTEQEGGWIVSIYDRVSKSIEYVEAGAGTEVGNPRFVLVYDSKKDNGDIETIGYDLDSKTTIPLGSLPTSVPEDIPEPDSTGEVRAIIQNKPPTEEDVVEESDTDAGNDPPLPENSGHSTTTELVEDGDIVVPPLDLSATTTLEANESEVPTLDLSEQTSDSDIEEDQSTNTDHITDIVIPK